MQTRFDAIIIGGGPAGSSAAILLATAGWSVCVIEKQVFPRRKVCGECLAATNLPLLEALGIGADFLSQAGPELHRLALTRGARTVETDLPPAVGSPYLWGRALGREVLDTLLLQRARSAGAVVLQPWAVQKINRVGGFHDCTVREAVSDRLMVLQAPVAILAHGSWEPLPQERAIQRRARSGSDLLAFKANFQGASLAARLLSVLMFNGGYGGIVLADHGIVTLACCIRADRLEVLRQAEPGRSAGEVVEAMLKRECQGVADALQGAQRLAPWLASGPMAPGIRFQPDEKVFRIGNAAGEAHPIIGEGMSMALQSAWLLCAGLVRARQRHGSGAGTAWQRGVREQYVAEWRRHFAPRLRLAATFAQLAMRPTTSAALMALVRWRPTLLTRAATWSGKVHFAADTAMLAALASSASGGVGLSRAHLRQDFELLPGEVP